MRITFVLPNLAVNGGVRVVFDYASALVERGHEVSIVYPKIPAGSLSVLRAEGLRRYVERYRTVRSQLQSFPWTTAADLFEVPTLYYRVLDRVVPDADVVIATHQNTVIPVAKLSAQKGVGYYFVQHYGSGRWKHPECWRRARKVAEKTGQRPDLAMLGIETDGLEAGSDDRPSEVAIECPLRRIVPSTYMKRVLEDKLDLDEPAVIPNGIDLDTFSYDGDEINSRAVLSLFRPSLRKGPTDLLEAFGRIHDRAPDADLIVFTPEDVQVDLPEWLTVHRGPSDEHLRDLYCSAGIFVMPSRMEGFGLTPLEAMACKTAVVTTNVGGVPDYADHGENALVCPSMQPDVLAERVLELLSDESRRQELASAGLERARGYTWDRAASELESFVDPA